MPDHENEIINRGYRKLPPLKIKGLRKVVEFKNFKYPVNKLRIPKNDLNDSMAVCVYSSYNIGLVNSYLRSVISVKFPERKFVLRKQIVKNKNRVVVYRVQ